jgi:hypothetical protein
MKTRSLSKLVLLVTLLCCSVSVAAQSRFTYDGGYAATYARNNAWMAYGTGYNQNPFTNFSDNCAHFVSQAIVAGMVRKTNPWDVYNRRFDFQADLRTDVNFPRWFFIGPRPNERGPAWTSAKEMHKYADWNKSTYKGLHFKHIVSDTPSKRSLTTSNVQAGDVIFCDWEDNKIIDHVVIVARVDKSWWPLNNYEKIKIASQSNNHADTALQYILDKNYKDKKTWASFRVYRPLDYNNAGL